MKRNKNIIRIFSLLMIFAIALQAAGCGTILYPERRGQVDPGVIVRGGVLQIDPGVAILDAVLLVFFVVPGIVAFAVDFSTGAIYLPSKKTGSLELGENNDFIVADIHLEPINKAIVEKYIREKTGMDIPLEKCASFKMKDRKNIREFIYSNHFQAI